MPQKYAFCKHGPGCVYPRCGYAHSLDELEFKEYLEHNYYWDDTSELPEGHSSPDVWFGQRYASAQMRRVLVFIAEHPGPYPMWCHHLAWFLGSFEGGPCEAIGIIDFDRGRRIREELNPHIKLCMRTDCMSDLTGIVPHSSAELFTHWNPPFRWAVDEKGLTFRQRMQTRLESVGYPLYRCVQSLSPTQCAGYAARTCMLWGATSRQYLAVEADKEYLLVGRSDDPEWWFVLYRQDNRVCGWAPPAYMMRLEADHWSATELDMPQLQCLDVEYAAPDSSGELSEEEYVAEAAAEPEDRVYLSLEVLRSVGVSLQQALTIYYDGSVRPDAGMAAAWILRGSFGGDRVSLRGNWIGAEVSELCAFVGAAMEVWSRLHPAAVAFRGDNVNCLRHLAGKDPVSLEGWRLYPAILLGRRLLGTLRERRTAVYLTHVKSKQNIAHHLAYTEQRQRSRCGWTAEDDRWGPVLPRPFLEVFRDVERFFVRSRANCFCITDARTYELPADTVRYISTLGA